jgi:hypothetical protein
MKQLSLPVLKMGGNCFVVVVSFAIVFAKTFAKISSFRHELVAKTKTGFHEKTKMKIFKGQSHEKFVGTGSALNFKVAQLKATV